MSSDLCDHVENKLCLEPDLDVYILPSKMFESTGGRLLSSGSNPINSSSIIEMNVFGYGGDVNVCMIDQFEAYILLYVYIVATVI